MEASRLCFVVMSIIFIHQIQKRPLFTIKKNCTATFIIRSIGILQVLHLASILKNMINAEQFLLHIALLLNIMMIGQKVWILIL